MGSFVSISGMTIRCELAVPALLKEDKPGSLQSKSGLHHTSLCKRAMPRSKEISAKLRQTVVYSHQAGKGYKTRVTKAKEPRTN